MSKAKKGPNGSDIEETVEVSPDKTAITVISAEIKKTEKRINQDWMGSARVDFDVASSGLDNDGPARRLDSE